PRQDPRRIRCRGDHWAEFPEARALRVLQSSVLASAEFSLRRRYRRSPLVEESQQRDHIDRFVEVPIEMVRTLSALEARNGDAEALLRVAVLPQLRAQLVSVHPG